MKKDSFYKDLKNSLDATTSFPAKYLYKFIVPSKGNGVKEIEGIFDHMGAVISTRESSKGTFTSVSITLIVDSSDMIIKKYKEVGKVKGVISL